MKQTYHHQYAVVGVGQHSLSNLYPVLHYLQVPIKYICVTSERKAQLVEHKFAGLKSTASLDDLLNDSDVTGIVVSATPAAHYSIASKVLQSGKALFIEKPPCQSSDELARLIELQRQSKAIAMAGLQKRHAPAVKILSQRLRREKVVSYDLHYVTGAYPEGDPLTTPVDTIDITGDTEGDRSSFAQETIYATDAQGQEDWLRVDLTTRLSMKTPGKYKARLVGSDHEASGWTHFLLASVENLTATYHSRSAVINNTTIYYDSLNSFSVIGGKPYLVRDEDNCGMADGGRVWLDENTHFSLDAVTGAWTLSAPVETTAGGSCLKLYVQTDYGVVVKRVSLT